VKKITFFLQDTFNAAKKSFDLFECHKKQNIEMPESICHQYYRIKKGNLFAPSFTNSTAK